LKRRGRKSAAQTPAPAKERVYGSKKNPAGSAASKSSASKIQLSQSIIKTLKDKVAKYNESHKKDVSLSTAKAVMRRGMGAYSKSHRPTITGGAPNSRQAWGFARVNKFLKKKSGEPVKKAYIQDDDLLKDGGKIKVGRLAKGMNLYDIAKHHGISLSELKKQLQLGIKTEMEHTYDKEIAKAIAYDHLFENPTYYSDLSKMEMQAEAKKLENYYKAGGETGVSCKAVDKEGQPLTDKESLDSMTKCLETLPQTKSLHFNPEKNDYNPERKKLHREIIYEFKKDLICVDSTQPIAILMGGSPASGKSTFLKKYAPYLLKTEILKIDADEIRAKLPEYKGYNASQTHLETKDIVNTLLSDRNIGIPCLFDVIYDGTMNNTKSYLPLINLLKSLGYKVFIVYIDKVPKDVVIKRSIERYKRSGRFVPLSVIDDFFEKGTEALERLKGSVDGYMVIDGSDTNYKVIERGGIRLPKNRNYSKIGEPITVKEEEIIREFKKGGEIDPDDAKIKGQITHKSGSAGGMLVGRRHSEGGIKAINKSTGQPLEMEGGEVVITRDAVSDPTLVEFEGKKMTKRQVLSAINESGGGVSFAEGGDIPDKCSCSGKEYNYGGKLSKDFDIVNDMMTSYRKGFGIPYKDMPHSEAVKKMFEGFYPKMKEGGEVYEEGGLVTLINKKVPSYNAFAEKNKEISQVAVKRSYKDYLKSNFDIDFSELPQTIQVALLLGNQKIVDNYINS
jgi:predicted ABC-type ATPase